MFSDRNLGIELDLDLGSDFDLASSINFDSVTFVSASGGDSGTVASFSAIAGAMKLLLPSQGKLWNAEWLLTLGNSGTQADIF